MKISYVPKIVTLVANKGSNSRKSSSYTFYSIGQCRDSKNESGSCMPQSYIAIIRYTIT